MDVIAKGLVELGKETSIDGLHVWLEPTRSPRKFYVRISTGKKPPNRIRHRRLEPKAGRELTEDDALP